MGICEFCGNHIKDSLKIVAHNREHEFDCFQCAIQSLAPTCASCSCRIIGQSIDENGFCYCGLHCQRMAGRRLSTEETSFMP